MTHWASVRTEKETADEPPTGQPIGGSAGHRHAGYHGRAGKCPVARSCVRDRCPLSKEDRMAQQIRALMTPNPVVLPGTASVHEAARAMRDADIGVVISM